MEEQFRLVVSYLTLLVEAFAAVIIAFGTIDAIVGLIRRTHDPRPPLSGRKKIWIGFAVWLLLSLEFELAADVIRTAISPTWKHDRNSYGS